MESNTQHICPWWIGKILVSPIRKLVQNPEKILRPFVKPGMKVVDYGCAMGFFTLPMAGLVGKTGTVYAIDVQKTMIDSLFARISKSKHENNIRPLLITENTDFADLTGKIDFALLFYMVHEVPDKVELFRTISGMLKPGGKVLFVEPRGHVTSANFDKSVNLAANAGLNVISAERIRGSHAVLLEKKLST